MQSLETILILLFAAILLVGIAGRFSIPYPIALVLGGTALGFLPNLKVDDFDPNLILIIVLPPILYYAAFGIPFRDFKQNIRAVFSLALGLVVVTTFVVALIFKAIFPETPLALCFAFGAIVSPPDAVAATSILKRFKINPKVLTLLEGESLINDASALVLYKLAILALISGSFSVAEGSFEFIKVTLGGIGLGIIFGYSLQWFSTWFLEAVLGVVFSFTIPYITYISANFMGVSGILAVVTTGLLGSSFLVSHYSSLRRVLGYAAWDVFIIFMNCFVFIIIGLQLRTILSVFSLHQTLLYSLYSFLIMIAMLVLRFIWVYFNRHNEKPKTKDSLKNIIIISWSGMRGIVSLVAAIAIPFNYLDGTVLEGRNEIIFMTFMIILLTLVIPGLTLPALIKWLKIQYDDNVDLKNIRAVLSKVALEKLAAFSSSKTINEKEYRFLKAYFISQLHVLEMSHTVEFKLQNTEIVRLKIIQAQRRKLLGMWSNNEIDDKLLNHLENELDMIEVHTSRVELT